MEPDQTEPKAETDYYDFAKLILELQNRRREVHSRSSFQQASSSRSRNNLNTRPPTQDRENDREFEWNDQESNRSEWIDLRVSWCGDRDGDTDSQCTPALHYTGYIVQTVCQY